MFGIVPVEYADRKDGHDSHVQYGPTLFPEFKESRID